MKTKKGFTLIELVIVMAIIGILALIAIGKICEIRGKQACHNNPGSKACIAYQQSAARSNQAATPDASVCPNVQVINDTTISYAGHAYKRID